MRDNVSGAGDQNFAVSSRSAQRRVNLHWLLEALFAESSASGGPVNRGLVVIPNSVFAGREAVYSPEKAVRAAAPPNTENAMNDVTALRHLDPVTRPISPAKFAHFVLRTGQFDRMIEWYRTVLAARVVFRDQILCFLSYDDEHHRLALINIPGLPVRDPTRSGPTTSPTPTTISASCCRPIVGSRQPASCRIGRSTMV